MNSSKSLPRIIYINQITFHIFSNDEKLEAFEVREIIVNKSKWSHLYVVSKKKN